MVNPEKEIVETGEDKKKRSTLPKREHKVYSFNQSQGNKIDVISESIYD